jgi:mono-ADP-ribosyltransferase sirtuin 6
MSASYAERLSAYPNKGQCGLPENYDTERSLSSKITKLAQLITESSYTVVLTGAGISTAAGIPDFRGPNGIWTREQQQEKKRRRGAVTNNDNSSGGSVVQPNGNKVEQKQEEETAATAVNFCTAKPTLTHRALAFLMTNSSSNNHNNNNTAQQQQNQQQTHYIQHLITQNIDGLHGKTNNIPRHKLSILHGDIFTEKCIRCEYEYVRPYEIESIGLKPTGRICTRPVATTAAASSSTAVSDCNNTDSTETNCCNGKLIDTLLDWEDSLPEKDWTKSQYECGKSQLILCLGTSLRIEPAGGLCMLGTVDGFDRAVKDGYIDDHVFDESDVDEEKSEKKSNNSKKKDSKRKRRRAQPPKKLGYVIVNLQETPYDDNAALVIRAKVDDVMERLMIKLGYGIGWDNTDKTK